jgi:hypothetical protein
MLSYHSLKVSDPFLKKLDVSGFKCSDAARVAVRYSTTLSVLIIVAHITSGQMSETAQHTVSKVLILE